MNGIIYRAKFPNNKSYIGQTTQKFEDRIAQHKYWAIHNLDNFLFHKAIRKYGFDSITWIIVEEEIDTIDLLNEKEQYWINYYNSVENGYNITYGGNNYNHLKLFDEENTQEILNKYKEFGSLKKVAEFFGCSVTAVKTILKSIPEENYKQFSYSGKGHQSVLLDTEVKEAYDYFVLTGSIKKTCDKYNISSRTLNRYFHKINPDYKTLEWKYKVNKEYVDDIYKKYLSTHLLTPIANEYGVSVHCIRQVLKYVNPNYILASE